MKRPAPHRLESRKVAAVLPAHRLWRHTRRFELDHEEHLLPGEDRVRRAYYSLIKLVIRRVWQNRVVEAEALVCLPVRLRHLWGDFRLERQAHLKEEIAAAYRRGEQDARVRVEQAIEGLLIAKEFPLR